MRKKNTLSWLLTFCLCGASLVLSGYEGFANVNPGPFAGGKSQLSLGGGSSTLGQSSYLILQGRYGYFLVNGLVLETGLQSWIPFDSKAKAIYVLSPGVTGYLYQLGGFVPYAGVFYQQAFSELILENKQALGARGGFVYRQGGGFIGLGARVTDAIDCEIDCRMITPEISLLLSF